MDVQVTLRWESPSGAVLDAIVPVISSSQAALASKLWNDKEDEDCVLLESCSTACEVVAGFISFVEAKLRTLPSHDGAHDAEALRSLLNSLLRYVCKASAPQSLAYSLRSYTKDGLERLRSVVRAQQSVHGATSGTDGSAVASAPSALVQNAEQGKSALFLQFGGQGYAALPELRMDLELFPEAVQPMLSAVSASLSRQLSVAQEAGLGRFYGEGFDVHAWLRADAAVTEQYLQSAPVSFPLIGLTQCAHFLCLMSMLGLREAGAAGWARAHTLMVGAVGHSQGVVSAAAAAIATDEASFIAATVAAVNLLFWQGVRMQEAYQSLPAAAPLPPAKPVPGAAPAMESPSPMLAVSGFTAKQLQKHVDSTNKLIAKVESGYAQLQAAQGGSLPGPTAPAGPALTISLINGPTSCVVSGRPAHCAALYSALDSVRAAPGADQARVPHSSRKPVLRLTYLRVSAPFHSPLLASAVPAALQDCARTGVQAVLHRAALQLPVYSTDNGRDLRSECASSSLVPGVDKMGLVEELLALQSVLPVDWLACCKRMYSPEEGTRKATHLLDLGPGGATGGARMTARVLQGTGLAVIVSTLATVSGSEVEPAQASAGEVVAASAAAAGGDEGFPLFDARVLLTPGLDVLAAVSTAAPDWAAAHGAKLVKRACDGTVLLDTAYSRLLGRAPVMVAGMTPCTSYYGLPLVAACLNAGFHAELACGGLPRPAIYRERIAKLQSMLAPGQGIGLNMLFLNARQWSFQYPMVGQLISEGVPIETVCIAAGVPSLDNGLEIVKSLAKAGVKYVSFKPGSVDAIKRTVDIAAGVAPFPVVLQWTGGRAGGHHSFEDVHAPILATYALIRKHSNVVLLAGSGMGSAACAAPWIDGSWAQSEGGSSAPMPFDGVLVASRVMVAKEAATSYEVKQVLVDTPGVENEAEWEGTYEGVVGGILTVKSELGEPIHKVANRGMLFCREMDAKVFSLPRDKRGPVVASMRDYIIAKLNADYQKVYFGLTRPDGAVVHPPQMTYAEVARKMVQTMYVQPEAERLDVEPAHENYTPHGRWLDPTFRDRLFAFLQRAEASLRPLTPEAAGRAKVMTTSAQLSPGAAAASSKAKAAAPGAFTVDNPLAFVEAFFGPEGYPSGQSIVLTAGDYDAWLEDCRSRGKPVPFVPVVDGDIENWFKKDSLWYSEDLAAVPGRDAGRVAILQGPVAVRHSTVVNEPVGDILGGINAGLIQHLLKARYGGIEKSVPVVEACGGSFAVTPAHMLTGGVTCTAVGEAMGVTAYNYTAAASHKALAAAAASEEEPVAAPDLTADSASILRSVCAHLSSTVGPALSSGHALTWVFALLSSSRLVHETAETGLNPHGVGGWKWSGNSLQRVFAPRPGTGRVLTIRCSAIGASEVTVQEGGVLVAKALLGARAPTGLKDGGVTVSLYDVRPATADEGSERCTLTMRLAYRPWRAFAPLALHAPTWATEVKRYYASLWFSGAAGASTLDMDVSAPLESSYVVTEEDIASFCEATGTAGKAGKAADGTSIAAAPTSFAIVAGWRALIACLFPRTIAGDILNLVHLSNAFELVQPSASSPAHALAPLTAGETVVARLFVTEVSNGPSGKTVTVEGDLLRSGGRYSGAPIPWVTLRSSFLFRGVFSDHAHSFKRSRPDVGAQYKLALATPAAVAVLCSKPWFRPARGAVPDSVLAGKASPGEASSSSASDPTSPKGSVLGASGSMTKPLTAGDRLAVTVHSREEMWDASTLRSVVVTGKVFRQGTQEQVGTIEYSFSAPSAREGLKANPVLSYLTRASAPAAPVGADGVSLLDGAGVPLLTTPDVVSAPTSNVAYAVASRDLNPIHRHAALADLAALPAPIVHGMWTAANGQRVLHSALDLQLGNVDASGAPAYTFDAGAMIRSYAASFVGMVLPGDKLVTQVCHVGMDVERRQKVMKVSTTAVRVKTGACEPVLVATARVDIEPTAYVFTGQGSAAPGMGMDLYESSPVAKAVWDVADKHLVATYGFSILHIVKSNPKSLTVQFGGRKGAAVRASYMALETEASDGSGRRVPLLPEVTEDSESFTFVHPEGLLFATQFTQPALVLVEKAAFDDMQVQGLIPRTAIFAGHSLGEYAALSAAVPLLPVPALVSLVFLRGMVMQNAVPRDEAGRSDFGMVACNPQRVGPMLTEPALHALVAGIAKGSKCLLEVVNYNVSERQYVVAGHLRSLDILGHALTLARKEPATAADPIALVRRAFEMSDRRVAEAAAAGKKLALERGEATIPLAGVDVPFHSTFLRNGVPSFRAVLRNSLSLEAFSSPGVLQRMLGCYLPNLTALPFSLERYFVAEAARRTSSPVLTAMLSSDAAWAEASADAMRLAQALVIELLAYQFASPVQWIATQHFMFSGQVAPPADAPEELAKWPAQANASPALPSSILSALGFSDSPSTGAVAGVRRIVEVGPAMTLVGMAARTLETGMYGGRDAKRTGRSLLWYGKDADVLYYKGDGAGPSNAEYAASTVAGQVKAALAPVVVAAPTPAPVPVAVKPIRASRAAAAPAVVAPPPVPAPAPAPVAAPAPAPAPAPAAARPASGPVAADEPPTPLEALQVMLSVKLNQPLAAIKADSTIKGLVGGKSAVQNEILGELEKEFGSGPDGAAEMALSDVAKAVAKGYKGPGKVTQALIAKLLAAKMPGGFGASAVREYLTSSKGLGPGRVDGVLLHAVACAPEARLGGEGEAKAWLDKTVDSYASFKGISLSGPAGGAAGAAGGGAGGLSPELLAMLLGGAGGASAGGASAGSAGPVPDAPASPLEFVRALLSVKLNQPITAIKADSTIKGLVGGKSAVQNEILGELEKEFGSGPDGGAEMPLSELAKAAGGGKYKCLGKVGSALVAKLVSAKMPGGFGMGQIKEHLSVSKGLGAGRVESVLLYGLTCAPEARLGGESEAKAWLDSTAVAYAGEYGVTLGGGASGAAPGGSGGMGAGAAAALAAMLGGAGVGGASDKPGASLLAYQKKMATLIADQVAAYQAFTGQDAMAPLRKLDEESAARAEAESALSLWRAEHNGPGEAYEAGLKPAFDARKVREYSSAWAWAAQEVHSLLHSALLPAQYSGKSSAQFSTGQLLNLVNRVCPELITLAGAGDAALARAAAARATAPWGIPSAKSPFAVPRGVSSVALAPLFAGYGKAVPGSASVAFKPTYAASFGPTAPHVAISPAGKLLYSEIPRLGVPTSRAYVIEMARAAAGAGGFLGHLLADGVSRYPGALAAGTAVPAGAESDPVATETAVKAAQLPHVHLRGSDPADSGARVLDERATVELYKALLDLTTDLPDRVPLAQAAAALAPQPSTGAASRPGVTFAGRVCLITGCGPGSIGLELVKGLLTGGATVVATTSRFSMASTAAFRKVYQECGAIGSRLIVLPFNQGSAADCSALIAHVTTPRTAGGLGLEPDYLIPFGAIPENGVDADGLTGANELAHRLMMTNVLRMLGALASSKRSRGVDCRPALCLLPLSPNHGVFGGDGLYAESKLGLEALMHKWNSEGWGDYITIAGAVIGWTRGTGLMAGNNVVSPGVEQLGCRTFSQTEMALNLMALLHPRMTRLASQHPLWADLRGGFHAVPDLKAVSGKIRKELEAQAAVARAVAADEAMDAALASSAGRGGARGASSSATAPPSAYVRLFDFPTLPSPARLSALSAHGALQGIVDLDKTAVAVGYGEVSPWGSARTRWDMERAGEFSLEGAILLAWITGRIKYYSGAHPNGEAGQSWHGWVDTATGEPVPDAEVKSRYEPDMLAHAGIRVIEPALFAGYDPARKLFLHTVALDKDMGWIEVSSKADAEEYVAWMGKDKVDVRQDEDGSGTWRIRLRKGATLSVPRAMRFDRWVAGQLPTGWDATRFGIPQDLVGRMDPVVLFTLVATAEALLGAGIVDAYEFYKYVHVSAVGNSIGGGMGGMASLQKIFRHRFTEGDVQSDILQESFINTTPAWVNMLLLSSSGPLKTPVGACATAAQSVDIAVETILTGKAAVMLCGGYDDFCEEGSYEFAQMGATSNSMEESAAGREPKEMVRPFAPTRGGFMESQGAGVAVLTTARLALTMGLPLRGVIALSSTASDKAGRSVPAPGQGVLTTARELPLGLPGTALTGGAAGPIAEYASAAAPLLDVHYRKRRLASELAALAAWRQEEEAAAVAEAASHAQEAAAAARAAGSTDEATEAVGRGAASRWSAARLAGISSEWTRLESSARARWCSDYWRNEPRIAPLRGALSVFGMGVDDITVASFHGTGTEANDKNESELVHTQMAHLGRTPGCPVYVVAQKALTGHPKGAAAAWMLNGALDMLSSGIVPGCPQSDDIDDVMRPFTHLAYLSKPLALGQGGVRSVLLKSFGFGQAGGEVLVLHPDYLLATLAASELSSYVSARADRERAACRAGQDVLAGKATLVKVKASPPYTKEQSHRVYLDPSARARYDEKAGEYRFSEGDLQAGVGKQAGGGASAAAVLLAGSGAGEGQEAEPGMYAGLNGDASVIALQAAAAVSASTVVVGGGAGTGLGVDVEPVRTFAGLSPSSSTLLTRNFTTAELTYCMAAPDPSASLAGRWAAKEAVVKALTAAAKAGSAAAAFTLQGAGAALADVEIVAGTVGLTNGMQTVGAPTVVLHGHAAAAAGGAGLDAGKVRLSISHSGDYAVAVAAL